ncbi:hypothetical protein HYQ44_011107 [Verticillium longisporum]|nr:hypothetical protein HYQ44_011107 [Verticillium longisporum]
MYLLRAVENVVKTPHGAAQSPLRPAPPAPSTAVTGSQPNGAGAGTGSGGEEFCYISSPRLPLFKRLPSSYSFVVPLSFC